MGGGHRISMEACIRCESFSSYLQYLIGLMYTKLNSSTGNQSTAKFRIMVYIYIANNHRNLRNILWRNEVYRDPITVAALGRLVVAPRKPAS